MDQQPKAHLTALEGGYQLTYRVNFTGDETDEDRDRIQTSFRDTWEQMRLIVQTLTLVGFQASPGKAVMERNGTGSWRLTEVVRSASESPAPEPPAVLQVQAMVRTQPPEPDPEVEPDPILRAAVEGKAPFMTKPLAAALTQATPQKERPTLARALGQTAETIYLWLLERPDQEFTIGEIGRAISHSDYVVANRLKDLDGAGLVLKGSRQGLGRHKAWATYRAAVVKEPKLAKR